MSWIPESMEFVLIVEGEIDFLSMKSIDPEFSVIATPSANYRFKDELEWFPKKIILMLDNDEMGQYHTERLKKKLEMDGFKVKVLNYPKSIKDFNDRIKDNKESAREFLKKLYNV